VAIANTETGRVSICIPSSKRDKKNPANQGSGLPMTTAKKGGNKRSLPGGRIFGCVSPDAWKPTCLYGAAGQ
jgi:hypothetical protein